MKLEHIAEQEQVAKEVIRWLQVIIQDIEVAYTTRSQRMRTAALNRAISALSAPPLDFTSLPPIGQLLTKQIIERYREVVTSEAGRAGKLEILTEVVSPYLFDVPVRGQGLVGREDLFRQIITLWSVPHQRNSLLIYGHRRMGKTSLAQAIESRCQFGQDTKLVYYSLDSSIKHEGRLYYNIAERLWLRVQDRMTEPQANQFTPVRARNALTRFLTNFHQVAKEERVILVLDEFELLHKYIGITATYEAIEYLRTLTQNLSFDWLTLALVGLHDLDDLGHSYGNALLGWAALHVSFLTPTQVATVLANPFNNPDFPLDYTPEALALIAKFTHGQPYLVQIIGHLLVQHYNYVVFTQQREHTGIFGVPDVQTVIDHPEFYKTAAAYFQGVWGQVTKEKSGEIELLKALANHEEGLSVTELKKTAQLDDSTFGRACSMLERHDILYSAEDRVLYTVPLMQHWVKNQCQPATNSITTVAKKRREARK